MKHLVAGVLLVLGVLVAAPSGQTTAPIQPGSFMSTAEGGCTLSFVYDGAGPLAGNVYLGTAAHCVKKVGEDVVLEDGTVFGDVAVIGDAAHAATDWALV